MESIQELRADLHRFREIVGRGTLISYSQDEKESLLENSQKLLQRLDAMGESVLTVGLLGGTGVGKSTLMNALAGAPIASTSHRRPHTERVLIYRHGEVPLPASLTRNGLWMEIVHAADAIRHILLCDLPDFDSLVGEHRRRVIQFLENLDVLAWVASPEKYGDARFYAFLRQVPKARQNFYFVLNKVDLLFQGRTLEEGYGELGKVLNRFTQHLVDNDIPDPIVFAVSADLACDSGGLAPWNQFPHFRHQIFQLRDAMEVTAIKTANLDVEVKRFLSVVEKEILQLAKMREVLEELVDELGGERQEWAAAGREAMDLWLDGTFRSVVPELLMDPCHLVGPARLVGRTVQFLRGWSGPSSSDPADGVSPPREAAFLLRSQMERLANRIARRLLHRGFAADLETGAGMTCEGVSPWERFLEKVREFTVMRLMDQKSAGPSGFRLIQWGVYLALLVPFVLAVSGAETWRDLLELTDAGSLLRLAADLPLVLFTPRGLAALGSCLILLLLTGIGFYSRYKKSLQRRTQKFIESLKLGLGSLWEGELQSVIEHLNQHKAQVESQVGELSSLYAAGGKD